MIPASSTSHIARRTASRGQVDRRRRDGRTFVIAVALLLCLVAAAACGGGDGASGDAAADPVVARVNGEPVLRSAVDAARAEARFGGEEDDAGDALEVVIDREIVRQEAERLGVAADEAEVEARERAVGERAGGEPDLEAALEKAGMTAVQLRATLAAGVLREAVEDARYPGVAAADKAVRSFYARQRDTLFTTPAAVRLEAIVVRNEGIAGNALQRLRVGRPFGEVARQFSIDPELKSRDGMLGWVALASLPEPLAEAAAELGRGEVSGPVQGPGGTWILKVAERRAERVTPLAEVREDIARGLTREARAEALDRWLARARERAVIERL